MQIADARIARDADVSTELKGVGPFRPGKIVDEIVHGKLEIVAIDESLIETNECIPWLVGVAKNSETLAGESPAEVVDDGGTEHGGVTESEALAVVVENLFGNASRHEGLLRIVQVLQRTAPEQAVLARSIEMVVELDDECVVVEAHRVAEAVRGIIQAVARREIVCHQVAKGLVEIIQHDGTGPDPLRVKTCDVLRA